MKSSLLSLLLLINLFFIPGFLYAGSSKDLDSIIAMVEEKYSEEINTKSLVTAVSKALEDGVPYEEVYRFVLSTAESVKSPDEVASYLNTVIDLYQSDVPADIIINTILQGIAKDLSESKIKYTILDMKNKLLFCKEIALNHCSRKKEENTMCLLTSGLFYTLNSGFSEIDIKNISIQIETHSKNERYFFHTLNFMMELKNLGIQKDTITKIAVIVIEHDFTISDMKKYQNLVSSTMKGGNFKEGDLDNLLSNIEMGRSYAGSRGESGKGATGSSSSKASSGKGSGKTGGAHSGPGKSK